MFEITPEDIALLDDETLRAVVARLCEAEVRRHGFSVSCVTWGGNQTAADGGIDVRVALPPGSVIAGFVPRASTGFQVKKQDMPRAEILDEMCPQGVLRPSIRRLADDGGAYIMVSSDGSVADCALTSRRDAMGDTVKGVANAQGLALDFYDRTRIATWVRTHESLIPWVRSLVGGAIPGWQSYGPWAHAAVPVSVEYLVDEKLRVHPSKRETEAGLSALEGIQRLRDELRKEQSVVRLVGLSGVGKTRLVQALFDERVGKDSLNPDLAIYTNIADEPDPQPLHLASNLVASGERAILVIDNCSPELHQRLSETCRDPKSKLSVITIEYDIRDDVPEGTAVFTLDTSSPELIERMLKERFPTLSPIDAHTIAEFSGGNARIGIALAATIERNETVAGLTDEQLFQRLFLQRHAPDEALYRAAQACSLVYSFQGQDVSTSDEAELGRLGAMIDQTPQELYRHVAELKRRDLVQQRGVWRAVLPHPIANRLAAIALQNMPYAIIDEHVRSSERLLKSFSRRLSYLHTSNEAVGIVKQWLGIGGLLEDAAHLNELGTAMFENVAPVAPSAVVAALERAVDSPEAAIACKKYVDLLRSIAYDAALFEACTTVMVSILTASDVEERSHAAELFTSLFSLCLSGTHATIEQRLHVINALVGAPDAKRRALGVAALKVALEAWHFNSSSSFEFGARSRDYGYWPRTNEEVQHWFRETLTVVERLACSDGLLAVQARVVLAEAFRGLWHRAGIPDELEGACRGVCKARFWPEGWLAIRQTLDFDGKGLDPEQLAKLTALEVALRPADLVQKVRAVVFSTRLQGVDFDDFEDHPSEDLGVRMARTELLAQELGAAAATDHKAFEELLPEVVSSDGRLFSFGQGLCKGSADPETMWQRLVTALATSTTGSPRPQVLLGFLHALRARTPSLAARLLDDAVTHETLAAYYPYLQVAADIEHDDVARLKRSLDGGKAPAAMYIHLAYGRATDPIPAAELHDLILSIADLPSGYDVAIEILHMSLHSETERKAVIAAELISAGCELLHRFSFTTRNDREDYRLGLIANTCLTGATGRVLVTELCGNLKAAVGKYATTAFYHDDLLEGIFRVQPIAALDGLCAGSAKELAQGVRILENVRTRKYVLGLVPEEDLLQWIDQDAAARYPAFARVIISSQRETQTAPLHWTTLALRFLERAPDPGEVLREFVAEFMPSGGWSGSLSSILEGHAALLDDLGGYPALAVVVAQEKAKLHDAIETQRRSETALDKRRDERFE